MILSTGLEIAILKFSLGFMENPFGIYELEVVACDFFSSSALIDPLVGKTLAQKYPVTMIPFREYFDPEHAHYFEEANREIHD